MQVHFNLEFLGHTRIKRRINRMELKLFSFIEETVTALEEKRTLLEQVTNEIEAFFENLLIESEKEYLNINSRVKTAKSLKEKMIRNQYYQKYENVDALFKNITDIIGIRIECRFIEDETDLYRFLKRKFSEKSKFDARLFCTEEQTTIYLNLKDRQPQDQKNGMKMYRLDGHYRDNEIRINFELQIKSLVNVFWGEIEHKIIYKNTNYVLGDQFYKDIMKSIMTSLSTIDQQLLLISNQFEALSEGSIMTQEQQMEQVLAKIVYDIFAKRMKETIGVLVEFKKSCEAIVKYCFREAFVRGQTRLNQRMLYAFEKVRNIKADEIDFTQRLEFDGQLNYNQAYIKIIGQHIELRLNEEFQWNLFFRILFEIEPDGNNRDFEIFMDDYIIRVMDRLHCSKLNSNFTSQETCDILEQLLLVYANCFVVINSVELLYDEVIDQITRHINQVIDSIYKNILTYEVWEDEAYIYLYLLEARIFMLFNLDIDSKKALAILNGIRNTKSNIEVPKGLIKHIYKLGELDL